MTNNIKYFTIFGERCSGTNFLEETITHNFNLQYKTDKNKHFFCFNKYNTENANDTLFIGIIRNPIYWLNSFSKELHHVPKINKQNLNNFLLNEFYSVEDETEIKKQSSTPNFLFSNISRHQINSHKPKINVNDLNYINGKKYKNIFELRKLKNYYLMNIMPNKVNNYILINYENLLYNFDETLNTIMNKFNLSKKCENYVKVKKYKKSDTYNFVKQREITFTPEIINLIWRHLDREQENQLGYFMYDNNNYFKSSKDKL